MRLLFPRSLGCSWERAAYGWRVFFPVSEAFARAGCNVCCRCSRGAGEARGSILYHGAEDERSAGVRGCGFPWDGRRLVETVPTGTSGTEFVFRLPEVCPARLVSLHGRGGHEEATSQHQQHKE